jgi:hypothetical protein
MSLTQNRWFRRFGIAAVTAVGLFVLNPGSPAQAHEMAYRTYHAPAHHVAFLPRLLFGFGGHQWHHDYRHWR